MKVGIGITTTPNRKDHLNLCREQINKHSFIDDLTTFVVSDENEKGVSHQKNLCLNYLFNIVKSDYVFLFDDDCFPISDGWIEYFTGKTKQTKQNHFIYCKPSINNEIVTTVNGIDCYNNCNGCMVFLTREAFEAVGFYNEQFGRYGFEHADYSNRIHWAGKNDMGVYLCPSDAGEYIYSLDLDNDREYNDMVKHYPSMKPSTALLCVRFAQKIYMDSLDKKQIYFPIEQ